MTSTLHKPFPASWRAEILSTPPLIAPARRFVYPHSLPGEEQALERGALFLHVSPDSGADFLATCALGFAAEDLPSGVWSCPRAEELLAVAGGYAYLIDTRQPEQATLLEQRPVTALLAAPTEGMLLLAGFHNVLALGSDGVRWTSSRLSWEGLTLGELCDGKLHGTGWHMMDDNELPFVLDLRTGQHTGGGF
ncbi:MAG: hypothetical protein PW735_04840 [Acidobacteriaceae bacterium]|nr:hypothetical protein [Acidobacteriaceae bacterium]